MAWLGGMGRGKIGGLSSVLCVTTALAAAGPASAEERKMLVGSFEDIQVFGDINVEILTGKSPTARAIGDKRVLDGAGQFDAPYVKMRTLRLEHNGNATSNVQAMEEADIFNRGSGKITVGGSGSCFIKQAGSAVINYTRIEKGSRQ